MDAGGEKIREMKATIKVEKEVEIETLHVSAGVRYWEDSTVNDAEDTDGTLIPCRNADRWEPVIEIDAGRIRHWPQGTTAHIHYKVCDDGLYILKDKEGNALAQREGYVPDIMSPEENGYGDYIIMQIDENGIIQDWEPDIDDFFDEDE